MLPCLEAWAFLIPATTQRRMIIGRNAYGALLVLEEASAADHRERVRILDPLHVTWIRDENLAFGNLIATWLPERQLRYPHFLDHRVYDTWRSRGGHRLAVDEARQLRYPHFLDHRVYDTWRSRGGHRLAVDEALVIKEPVPFGGKLDLENFQVEPLVDYYRSTGPIFAAALGVARRG
ncbi:MAG: hypothetical protein HYY06_17935 [Deltaproteobacteria bacterium]|nr:hypothetical protein [Deltaproteobacteria bacterium]